MPSLLSLYVYQSILELRVGPPPSQRSTTFFLDDSRKPRGLEQLCVLQGFYAKPSLFDNIKRSFHDEFRGFASHFDKQQCEAFRNRTDSFRLRSATRMAGSHAYDNAAKLQMGHLNRTSEYPLLRGLLTR